MNRKVNLFSSSFICLFLLAQRPTWGADASDGVPMLFNDENHLPNSLNRKLRNLNEIVQEDVSENSHEVDELEKHEEEEEDVEVEEEQHEQQHGHTVEDPREGDEGNENDPQEGTHEQDDEDFMGQWTEVMANEEGDSGEGEDDTDSEDDAEGESNTHSPRSPPVEGSDATVLQAEPSTALSDSSNSAQIGQQGVHRPPAGLADQTTQRTGDQGADGPHGDSGAATSRAGGSAERGPSGERPQERAPGGTPELPANSVPQREGRSDALPQEQQAQSEVVRSERQSGAAADGGAQPSERPAAPPQQTSRDTPPKGTADSNDAKIKYLDKLYDEVLTTSDNTSGIHVPDYHSKYNTIRQKYEYSMNPVEYEIVKNLFNVGFKNDGAASSDATPLVDVFKKALADEKFQAEFDNFVHGLYGFAKRHSYLSKERMGDTTRYSDLLKNAISLMNTIEVN
ncbi:merozoite surface protein 7 (MSP7) [Plasmodium vivax]|uniref:Merozoite surface protein 7 (MSP7) n=1 Tax=Plasmodium vivax (strain Salvador I) TaxID=126793 RepID=A5K7Z5_PLAVS|nr:merozoite surface protein 7 (MSP7) [Plasmodium vivax]EDL44409.1 merozoite surface protein 7 (MSP7) [Plasmodium vivax]|eukprot:XP_001614136.1 merozoite surface protein 7 (MSP7) [Plasmodium vivax Sal-1]